MTVARFPSAIAHCKANNLRLLLGSQALFFIAFALAIFAVAPCGQCQTGVTSVTASNLLPLEDGERQLEEGRSALDERTLTAARKVFEECIHRDGKHPACYYGLARSDSYLVKAKESQNDKKAAERWLDSAIEKARSCIVLNDRSTDAHALLADFYGSKIGFGGMFAGMRYGPKANDETQRPFLLDPKNPRAYAVVGRKYLYSPKMFGGDLDKAIDSFRRSTMIDPHGDEAFVWLAIAYRKKGDEIHSQAAVAEALRLNSRSVFAKRVQAGAAN
jgi:tetratricopeptide (TPR) repeat protein